VAAKSCAQPGEQSAVSAQNDHQRRRPGGHFDAIHGRRSRSVAAALQSTAAHNRGGAASRSAPAAAGPVLPSATCKQQRREPCRLSVTDPMTRVQSHLRCNCHGEIEGTDKRRRAKLDVGRGAFRIYGSTPKSNCRSSLRGQTGARGVRLGPFARRCRPEWRVGMNCI